MDVTAKVEFSCSTGSGPAFTKGAVFAKDISGWRGLVCNLVKLLQVQQMLPAFWDVIRIVLGQFESSV